MPSAVAKTNHFLAGLRTRPTRCQWGLWCSIPHPATTEVCAGSGFEWMLFDMEHSPSDMQEVLAQLRAAEPYPTACVVRPPSNDPVAIKRLLDIGAQTLLVPFVQSAAEAEAAVAAASYPPRGTRGVTMSSRASGFGRQRDYLRTGADEVAVVVQIETRAGLENLEAIAAVPGLAGVFIGPADLSADLGLLGQPESPQMRDVIAAAGARLRACGMPWGTLVGSPELADHYAAHGAAFVAVGVEQTLLRKAADALAERFGLTPA
jgi:4-hydroxy-2-oxoheptanedioate aldolase